MGNKSNEDCNMASWYMIRHQMHIDDDHYTLRENYPAYIDPCKSIFKFYLFWTFLCPQNYNPLRSSFTSEIHFTRVLGNKLHRRFIKPKQPENILQRTTHIADILTTSQNDSTVKPFLGHPSPDPSTLPHRPKSFSPPTPLPIPPAENHLQTYPRVIQSNHKSQPSPSQPHPAHPWALALASVTPAGSGAAARSIAYTLASCSHRSPLRPTSFPASRPRARKAKKDDRPGGELS